MGDSSQVQRRKPRVSWLVVVVLLLFAMTTLPVVSAHAVISDTTPGQSSHVSKVPHKITMNYTSGVDEIRDLSVTGPDGNDVTVDILKPGDISEQITVEIEDAGSGIYVVEWAIISADSHPTSGEWFFTAGEQPPDPSSLQSAYESNEGSGDQQAVERSQILPKSFLYLAVILLIGCPVVVLTSVLPVVTQFGLSSMTIRSSVTQLLLAGSGLAVVASGGLFADSVTNSDSLGAITDAATSQTGGILLVQMVIAVCLIFVLLVAMGRNHANQPLLVLCSLGGVGIALGLGATSHSAGQIDWAVGAGFTLIHLTGGAIWIGGLISLAVVLPELLGELEPSTQRDIAWGVLQRFSMLAFISVTTIVATGLGLTAWLVPTPTAVFETVHGTVLLLKLVLGLAAVGVGGCSRYLLIRRLEPTREGFFGTVGSWLEKSISGDDSRFDTTVDAILRLVRIEIGIVILVLLLSGTLTAAVPTSTAVSESQFEQRAETLDIDTDGLDATVTILPVAIEKSTISRFKIRDQTPMVMNVQLSRNGVPVILSDEEGLIASHERTGTTINPTFEETDVASEYETTLLLPKDGTWEVRLNVWTGNSYLDNSFTITVVAEENQGNKDSGLFTRALWIGASTLLIAGIAVSVQGVRSFEPVYSRDERE